ncbi:MAG: ribose-5-phosphate isomerase RpiA [Immundisolibacteraceae bacterium]|nr:ribose-5-phosphate isomerase RpiA [Immundisolibacteraceae bacterium]
MNIDHLKQRAAEAALAEISDGMVVGVGTGSTINFFIKALATIKHRVEGAVSSSRASRELLEAAGIPVLELNATGNLPIYIDGADEATTHRDLIKGGGGALTQEKIIAAASERFVCIVDQSKLVDTLGEFPLPVEVLPMARSYVARRLVALGGNPAYRMDFITDNGNIILDVHNLDIIRPGELEQQINNIPGVVTNGLFSMRKADQLIVAQTDGLKIIT